MPVLFGRYCIAPILLDLARQHPEMELHLSSSDRPVDVLAEGFDLAIRSGTLGADSEGLRARKLVVQRKRVCAAPAYLAAHGTPISVADLQGRQILHYRHADRVHTWQLPDASGRIVEVPLRSRFLFDDLEVIAEAALAGMGLAWLPEWLVRDRLQSGALVPVLDDQPGAAMECHALWPASQHTPLRVRLAVDALVEQLPRVVSES
jgi:DNA-binding transcriptional LysR family regulator